MKLSLDVRWTFVECSLDAHWTFVGCSLGVRWIIVYLLLSDDVRGIVFGCSLYVRWMFVGLSLEVRWNSVGFWFSLNSLGIFDFGQSWKKGEQEKWKRERGKRNKTRRISAEALASRHGDVWPSNKFSKTPKTSNQSPRGKFCPPPTPSKTPRLARDQLFFRITVAPWIFQN